MKGKLTTRKYWDKQYQWTGRALRIYPILNLSVAELDTIFKKTLPINREYRFLEVGCAPGIWMDYFHRKFRYNVEGIEYTDRGIEKTEKNLRKLRTPYKLYHQDFFDNTISNKYDVVFSGGFVEHFEDVDDAIERHVRLLKSRGVAIIEVPNLSGWNGMFQKRLDREIYKKHNTKIMNEEYFRSVAEKLDLDIIFVGYVGRVNLGILQGGKALGLLFFFIQSLLTAVYIIFGKRIPIPDSKRFSPYILSIYKNRR